MYTDSGMRAHAPMHLQSCSNDTVPEDPDLVHHICLHAQDPAELWNSDSVQTAELFARMVKAGEANCLGDNRWSVVHCAQSRRDPALAAPAPGRAAKPVAEEAAQPAAVGVAAAIKVAAAGTA